jgi:hypothetical protein
MDAIATQPERQSGCELVYIPAHAFPSAWPAIEPLIPSIVERSAGRVSAMTLIRDVAEGRKHVWTVWDGNEVRALVGADVGFASTGLKICTINFAAGRDSHEWIHLLSEIEDWAVLIGCKKMEMWARKGWARKLPTYKMSHVLLEKDL